MGALPVGEGMPGRASQAVGVEKPQHKIVAVLLVKQIGDRKTHHGEPSSNDRVYFAKILFTWHFLFRRLHLFTNMSEQFDEDGEIDSSNSSNLLTRSKSLISLHGIEVPHNLFPDYWLTQKNQARLAWPLPILLVIDVCGPMDLDLNSSRTQILMSEKWLKLEEKLAHEIFSKIMEFVTAEHWKKLNKIQLKA